MAVDPESSIFLQLEVQREKLPILILFV